MLACLCLKEITHWRAFGVLNNLALLIFFPVIIKITSLFFPLEKIWILIVPELAAVFGCHRFLRHAALSVFPPWAISIVFILFCTIWTISTIVVYRLIYLKNISVQKTAVILLSFFSIMTIFFLTPGTGNDEQFHYAFAYKYANICIYKRIFAIPLLSSKC